MNTIFYHRVHQRFPSFYERDTNLSLVNSSRPKPQTANKKY